MVFKTLVPNFQTTKRDPLGISDHNIVHIEYLNHDCEKSHKVKVFDLQHPFVCEAVRSLDVKNWLIMYTEPDINKKVKILNQSIEEAMQNIPYKIVKMKKNNQPWITPLLKKFIDLRWISYKNQILRNTIIIRPS